MIPNKAGLKLNGTTGYCMQSSTHCEICHQDYYISHNCSAFTNATCQRCINEAETRKIMGDILNEKKYCPYCGHKL